MNARHACQKLGNAVDRLREDGAVVKPSGPKLDVKSIWSEFVESGHSLETLDGLEFRSLCSTEETAFRPEFVAALARKPEMLRRSRCLYGLVGSYFTDWRAMADPVTVEKLLIAVFKSYAGVNPVVARWLANPLLFSAQATTSLAEEICSGQKAVDDVLGKYYVGPITKLARAVRASAAKTASEYLRRVEGDHDSEWRLRYLQWMTQKVFTDLTSPSIFADAIGLLILSKSAQQSESFQRALRSYIHTHRRLGDPRLRESAVNWRAIDPQAAQLYLSWLARDSILLFFNTILPNTSENRRRKDFWLRYHSQIKDFQVALSEADVWKVKANQKPSEVLHYSKVAHPTTSAFLMKFTGYDGEYLIVEFSETGHAAYIFKMTSFAGKGLSLRTSQFELKKHLKFDDTHRILHMHDWEPKASYKLVSQFGIRP